MQRCKDSTDQTLFSLGGRRIVKTTQLIRKKVFILICINYIFRVEIMSANLLYVVHMGNGGEKCTMY